MISFDGNGLPFSMLAVAFVLMAACYALSGLVTESTWRKNSLRDLELGRRLREVGTEEALQAAEDCEQRATKRIDAHCHKTNALSLAFGVLVRGVPYFSLMMVFWLFYQLWIISTGAFGWKDCFVSLIYWLVAGLAAEGAASMLGTFTTPLSKRWKRETEGGDNEGGSQV